MSCCFSNAATVLDFFSSSVIYILVQREFKALPCRGIHVTFIGLLPLRFFLGSFIGPSERPTRDARVNNLFLFQAARVSKCVVRQVRVYFAFAICM